MDYSTLKKGQLRLVPLPEQEPEWRGDYTAMSEEMFFGDKPSFDEILKDVTQFEVEFNKE